MLNYLRRALARLWPRPGHAASAAADTGHHERGDDASARRRRFWAELREGQREADAHSRVRF